MLYFLGLRQEIKSALGFYFRILKISLCIFNYFRSIKCFRKNLSMAL